MQILKIVLILILLIVIFSDAKAADRDITLGESISKNQKHNTARTVATSFGAGAGVYTGAYVAVNNAAVAANGTAMTISAITSTALVGAVVGGAAGASIGLGTYYATKTVLDNGVHETATRTIEYWANLF